MRRFILFGTPLCLGLLEIGHQSHFGPSMYTSLLPIANWWFILHLVQLPLLGLLALTVYILGSDLQGKTFIVNRIALAMFIVSYMAMDAIQGVATGFIIKYNSTLPAGQQIVISRSIDALWSSPILGNISFISVIGSLGWVVAVLTIAYGLYKRKLNMLAALFALSAIIFGITHAFPFGPIGMSFFFVSVLLYEKLRKRKILIS